MTVRYTEEAELDLIDIGVYTLTQWGERQWLRYAALLTDACERHIPASLPHVTELAERPGLFRFRCEHHVIYFRKLDDDRGIEIVRVLHERMLPLAHL